MRPNSLEGERRGRAVFLQINFFTRRERGRFGVVEGELERALDAVRGDDLAQGYETLRLCVG